MGAAGPSFSYGSGAQRSASLGKIIYELDPVSDIYGARIIMDGAKKVGYVNLRTFIGTAESGLRAAFAQFKAQGVMELIIDLRYNGGGLISVAELVADLLAEGRAGQIFEYVAYRDSKASLNESYALRPLPESIAPTKVAFIATGHRLGQRDGY